MRARAANTAVEHQGAARVALESVSGIFPLVALVVAQVVLNGALAVVDDVALNHGGEHGHREGVVVVAVVVVLLNV